MAKTTPKPASDKKTVSVRDQAAASSKAKPSRTVRLKKRFIRPKKDSSAAKNGIFRKIGRVIVPKYFRNSWRELKEVTWPDRKTTWKLTSAVLIFAVVFGLVIAVVDYGLDKLFKEILLK